MAKKKEDKSLKSQKKKLLLKVEDKLSDSLTEFPKKINEKKYKKVIHKAGKILAKSMVVNPVKVKTEKKVSKKIKKNKIETKTEAAS